VSIRIHDWFIPYLTALSKTGDDGNKAAFVVILMTKPAFSDKRLSQESQCATICGHFDNKISHFPLSLLFSLRVVSGKNCFALFQHTPSLNSVHALRQDITVVLVLRLKRKKLLPCLHESRFFVSLS